jgi:hypothetical protein
MNEFARELNKHFLKVFKAGFENGVDFVIHNLSDKNLKKSIKRNSNKSLMEALKENFGKEAVNEI